MVLSDAQVADIRLFCKTIKDVLDTATFEQTQQVPGMLDVRGTLAIEDNERVIYVKCLVTPQQRLSLLPTSPSLCCHNGTPYMVTARLVVPGVKICFRNNRSEPQTYIKAAFQNSFAPFYAEPSYQNKDQHPSAQT
jgi:hypothetical protein